jgi:hypothetical protein
MESTVLLSCFESRTVFFNCKLHRIHLGKIYQAYYDTFLDINSDIKRKPSASSMPNNSRIQLLLPILI